MFLQRVVVVEAVTIVPFKNGTWICWEYDMDHTQAEEKTNLIASYLAWMLSEV